MSDPADRDHYQRHADLSAAGVLQLVAEECLRAGPLGEKQQRFVSDLAGKLGVVEPTAAAVLAAAEAKRLAGALGEPRRFQRRQLYARVIRYAYWAGDPPEETAGYLRTLRRATGFSDLDHDVTMERLIDLGWAPPRKATSLVPGSSELAMREQLEAAKAALAAETLANEEEPGEAEAEMLASAGEMPAVAGAPVPAAPVSSPARAPAVAPSPRTLLGVGLALGILVAAVPLAYMKGALDQELGAPARPAHPVVAPTPSAGPTAPAPGTRLPAPPVAASPPARPARPPTPAQAPPGKIPGERFAEGLEAPGAGLESGLEYLVALTGRLAKPREKLARAVEMHARERAAEVEGAFARRSEANYRAMAAGGGGGYGAALAADGLARLREVELEHEVLAAAVHAHFLAVLAFMVEPGEYEAASEFYARLVPILLDSLDELPELRQGAVALPLRTLAEDLQDGAVADLRRLGSQLLRALEG